MYELGGRYLSTPPRELPIPPVETLEFVNGYDAPSANVVLISSDRKGLRVHDYHLKSASSFFLNLLEAGTTGGPVPIEATALQLEFMMDRVTGKESRVSTLQEISKQAPWHVKSQGWRALWSLIQMDEIANKYMLTGVSEYLHRLIASCAEHNPPETLHHACNSFPVDAEMIMAALNALKDNMPSWMVRYFDRDDAKFAQGHQTLSFAPHNVCQALAMSLGPKAFIAYTKALGNGRIVGLRTAAGGDCHDWEVVAVLFLQAMEVPPPARYWLLEHEDVDVKSGWSTRGPSPRPSPSPLLSPPRPVRLATQPWPSRATRVSPPRPRS